ncbi:hypothetical protein [Maricaulis maris]|uniref:hypothetical protein n=1 Tax=Maricaulis maris TaxID=74318 RepID=UPI003BAD98E3
MTGKPGRGRRDAVDIYPAYLMFLNGMKVREIAADHDLSEAHMRKRINELRALSAAELDALHETATQRRRRQIDIEFLRGDPAKASKLATAYTAVCRVARLDGERDRFAHTPNKEADSDDTAEPASVPDIESDATRQLAGDAAVLRRCLVQAEESRGGDRDTPDLGASGRRHPGRLPLPRDGPATPAAG